MGPPESVMAGETLDFLESCCVSNMRHPTQAQSFSPEGPQLLHRSTAPSAGRAPLQHCRAAPLPNHSAKASACPRHRRLPSGRAGPKAGCSSRP